MAFYASDLWPLMMRAVEALDRGETISFADLRRRIREGELRELVDEAGNYPEPAIPDVDWQDITNNLNDVLATNQGDEGEHFYVSRNGYCLLIAVLKEIERDCDGLHRP